MFSSPSLPVSYVGDHTRGFCDSRSRAERGDAVDLGSVWILGVSLALTVLVYRPVLFHPFVYEDSNWWQYAFGAHEATSRWLPGLALTRDFWVANPMVMHLESLWVHLLNGLLVFALAVSLRWPLPGAVAGLFLLHPLNSEAVSYASALSQVVWTFWALLAVVAYLRGWWGVMLAGLVEAQRTNPVGLSSIGLVLLAWWWYGKASKVQVLRSVGAGILLSVGLILFAQGQFNANDANPVSWWTWWSWEATATYQMIGKFFVPLSLSVDHGVELTSTLVRWLMLLAFVFTASGPFIAGWRGDRSPKYFAAAWVVLTIVPRFALRMPKSILTEHHFYPAMVGMSLLVTWYLSKIGSRSYVDSSNGAVLHGGDHRRGER